VAKVNSLTGGLQYGVMHSCLLY